MNELIKTYIGKECIIYTFEQQVNGIINEVVDNWISINCNGTMELVNIDFVKRIKEYPKNKNGKKKSVILD